ncbi:MAG: hypothetical protein A3G81_18640 [Betaproteobacteria bacterium RIFCSPLOWO2_12_FULL_65_14]|nr:MAG: hypothetical protein A3G81_18640 [Betaproteobacteria bacterium RIFCSPLOWO2_12_FULL_65_14]
MLTMRIKKLIVGVAVLAASGVAMAQSPEQLVEKYTPLLGNNADHAKVLVTGLRNGTPVVVKGRTPRAPSMDFTPPTGKMGFGNVDNALTLAERSLASWGIVTGTAQSGQRAVNLTDIQAVLMGDRTVSNPRGGLIQFPGILILRSQGMGWGEIANHPQVNVKL